VKECVNLAWNDEPQAAAFQTFCTVAIKSFVRALHVKVHKECDGTFEIGKSIIRSATFPSQHYELLQYMATNDAVVERIFFRTRYQPGNSKETKEVLACEIQKMPNFRIWISKRFLRLFFYSMLYKDGLAMKL